ncbi:MAG: transcription initiation factor IIB family protein [Candidatus Micrarchaeota archaeon]|nr:transcription initiation factor IIB family protein [Candidatus Micrarchaeota archaeon]
MEQDSHTNYHTIFLGESEEFIHANEGCKGSLVDSEVEGELLCSACGAVQSGVHQIIPLLEVHQRSFGKERRLNLLNGNDFNGKRPKAQFEKLLRTQNLVNQDAHTPPSSLKGLPLIDHVGAKLGLNEQIILEARQLFNIVIEKKLSLYRPIKVMAAAAIFLAARNSDVPRSMKEVVAVADLKKKELSHAIRVLDKALGYAVKVADPTKMISKIAENCKISELTKRKALEITERYLATGEPVGNPSTFSATVLHLAFEATGESCKGLDILKAARVDYVTVRYRKEKIGKILTRG